MSKYHVNPSTMKVGACKAKEGNCPFGNIEHYSTKAEAEKFANKELEKKYGIIKEVKPLKKLTKKSFIKEASEGPIEISEGLYYVAKKVNSENFELTPGLKEQLTQEGKYDNTYIGIVTRNSEGPYSMEDLPVYGNSDRYETKWLESSLEDAVESSLKDRGMQLLKRVNSNIEEEFNKQ